MNTSIFIKKYCKPTLDSATIYSLDKMMSHIVDYETIREYLVAIDYQDYLKTLYWKSISKYIRSKFDSCKCGVKDKLHVHHNTYKYVGIEHLHINCLDVMCDKCHSLIHSCEGAPKSIDRGVGYVASLDSNAQKYNQIKLNRKKQKPTGKNQNKMICELYVKHRMYDELKKFKAMAKLPKSEQMTVKQKWAIINELIQKTK